MKIANLERAEPHPPTDLVVFDAFTDDGKAYPNLSAVLNEGRWTVSRPVGMSVEQFLQMVQLVTEIVEARDQADRAKLH